MVTYRIVVEKRAEKALRKLPKDACAKVSDAIDCLAADPYPAASRRLVGSTGYRLRVGEYRMIYEVDHGVVTIYILKIGHRREVYR